MLLLSSCGIDNNIKKGEAFLALGEYYDAGEQFKKAYSKTPPKRACKAWYARTEDGSLL